MAVLNCVLEMAFVVRLLRDGRKKYTDFACRDIDGKLVGKYERNGVSVSEEFYCAR